MVKAVIFDMDGNASRLRRTAREGVAGRLPGLGQSSISKPSAIRSAKVETNFCRFF